MRVVGRSRKGTGDGPNEDSIGWDEDRPLAFVADGMGGYASGEVASRLSRIRCWIRRSREISKRLPSVRTQRFSGLLMSKVDLRAWGPRWLR